MDHAPDRSRAPASRGRLLSHSSLCVIGCGPSRLARATPLFSTLYPALNGPLESQQRRKRTLLAHVEIEPSNKSRAIVNDSHHTAARARPAVHVPHKRLTPAQRSTHHHLTHREVSHPHNILCGLRHSLHNPFWASIQKRFDTRSAPLTPPSSHPFFATKSRPQRMHDIGADLLLSTLMQRTSAAMHRAAGSADNGHAADLLREKPETRAEPPSGARARYPHFLLSVHQHIGRKTAGTRVTSHHSEPTFVFPQRRAASQQRHRSPVPAENTDASTRRSDLADRQPSRAHYDDTDR